MKKIIPKVKRQPPEVCASNMVKVIEQAQNGGVWMLDVGEIEELDMPVMWKPVLQD